MADFGIIGAGSLGQIFAAALSATGHAVTLVATPRSHERIARAGAVRIVGALAVEVPVADHAAPGTIGLVTDAARLTAGAGVIFTPKGYDLPGAVADIATRWQPGPTGWVSGIQNGIVKDDLLTAAFGAAAVVGAVTITGGQRNDDGTVTCTSRGATYFGEFSDERSDRAEAVAAALNEAGLPTQAVTNIRTVLWSKMCNAAGLFAVTCLSRVSNTRIGHHADVVLAYAGLIRETASIAAAQGIPMGDYPGFPIKTYLEKSDDGIVAFFKERATPLPIAPGTNESRTSMHQDLRAGRPLEVDAIYGDVVERAARVGVPAPRLTIMRDLVRSIDPARQSAAS
jgi:2-dehydropantoate 2-reductase